MGRSRMTTQRSNGRRTAHCLPVLTACCGSGRHRATVVLIVLTACYSAVSAVSAAPATEVRVEAYAGQPLGVARVVIPLANVPSTEFLANDGFAVNSAEQRPLYPVFSLNRQL